MPIRSSKLHSTPRMATALGGGTNKWARHTAELASGRIDGQTPPLTPLAVNASAADASHPAMVTERFDLRPLTLEHAPYVADLGADPDVVKTLICDWSSAEQRLAIARAWIKRNQVFGIWGVFDRDGRFGGHGRFIGFCAVDEPLEHVGQGPEIYYAFCRSAWGKGVATEVVGIIMRHLFRRGDIGSLEALVLAGLNPASRRLLENLGMRLIGRFPHVAYADSQCAPTIRYEVWRVRTATPSNALRRLEEAAYKIGQFVAEGVGSKEAVAASLSAAAEANGLAARLGEGTVADIVDESLAAGLKENGLLHYRLVRHECPWL